MNDLFQAVLNLSHISNKLIFDKFDMLSQLVIVTLNFTNYREGLLYLFSWRHLKTSSDLLLMRLTGDVAPFRPVLIWFSMINN